MIIESILGTATVYIAYKWLIDRDKNLQRINNTFKAIGFTIKTEQSELTPKYKGKGEKEEYLFKMPIGKSFEELESKVKVFEDAFPFNVVDMTFEKGLIGIRILEPLPIFIDWEESIITGEWDFPIGYGPDGWVYHNFNHYPHLIVAGITRYGKTEFLKMLITSMILQQPELVHFALIDLKGGLSFTRFEKARQVIPVASNIMQAQELLEKVEAIVKKRYEIFKRLQIEKITEWDRIEGKEHQRLFVIIDEAAELSPTVVKAPYGTVEREAVNECQRLISYIARIGAGLGIHAIFCTQYPTADILDKQIKINAEAKMSFRLSTSVADKVVFDQTGLANKIKPGLRGRAWYRTDKDIPIQVPLMENKDMKRIISQNKGDEHDTPREEGGTPREDSFKFGDSRFLDKGPDKKAT